IFVLNLLNLYTLFIALYNKQQDLLASISGLQSNVTVQNNCSSTFQITTVAPIATTMSLSDLHSDDTTVATIYNTTNRACVNVTDIPLKVKEFCWETMIGQ
ncbi:Transmembrane channel-like protein 3, partial [Biomphalaria glabrata]